MGATSELRRSGLEVVGNVPWGTHFCQFYETARDLIAILVPYFKAGLEDNEFCMWVTSKPLEREEAEAALREAVPDLDQYLQNGQIEIVPHTQWYMLGGHFDQQRVLQGWVSKLEDALARGFDGLRLTGNTLWLERTQWDDFARYEAVVDKAIGRYRMIAICTYHAAQCDAMNVADVVSNHQFALMRRGGKWTAIESSERKRAKEERSALMAGLDTMFRLSKRILEETTMQGMLQTVADAARELTGAQISTVGHRYGGSTLQLGVFCSPIDIHVDIPQVFRTDRGSVYLRVINELKTIRFGEAELETQPDWQGLPAGHVPLRGLLGAPLTDSSGTASGLIMVSCKEGGDFTETDELLLSNLAALASLALRQSEAKMEAEEHAEELAAVNREIEAFSYSVSHDLRAPLRAADGFSAALLEDCGESLNDVCKAHIQRVRAATQRMGDLIDDLLELSRVGRREMRQESVDLSELAQSIVDGLRSVDPDRQIEALIQPGLLARGDPHLLGVVLQNLLSNAWKFTSKRDSARIEFGATKEDGDRVYFVRDNGAGFDPAYADKLFAPFQRLHSTADYPGTGIGLATVQRIIYRHRGRIWAEGAVDKGATFRFTLPAS